MGKWQDDLMLDAAFDYLATSDKMIACSDQPLSYTEAVSTYALADVAMGSGDFVKADGDTSGRKVTINAKAAVPVDATGKANHIALVNTTSSRLVYVTTCADQGLSMGGSVNLPSWDIEIADAT